jgi:CRISPR system Cascade subunit CasE
MYLSKIPIIQDNDCHLIHQDIMKCFAGRTTTHPARQEWGILYRIEQDHILVQSKVEPNWTMPAKVKEINYAAINFTGKSFVFKLKTNPQKRLNNQKIQPILDLTEQKEWIERKAQTHGFSIDKVNITKSKATTGFKATNKITLNTSYFDGILTVVNPIVFLTSLIDGIGQGKAYGLGLLSIRKLK